MSSRSGSTWFSWTSRRRPCSGMLLALALLAGAPVWAAPPLAGSYAPQVSRRVVQKGPVSPHHTITFATFNVENLYRYRQDPIRTSHFDRPGRPAIPDYIPLSAKAYRHKLEKLARTIVKQLKTPDVVSLQEIENFKQTVALEQPVLADLAREIARQTRKNGDSGVSYRYALVPGASDSRGIGQGFLYRADRVRLADLPPQQPARGEVLGANPAAYNRPAPRRLSDPARTFPAEVCARPVIIGAFEVFASKVGQGSSEKLFVVNSHLKSNPEKFKLKRRSEARFASQLIRDLLRAHPEAHVIAAGDMNVDFNTPHHQHQLRPLQDLTVDRPAQAASMRNVTANLPQDKRYSYKYRGQRNLLDWVYASRSLADRLIEVRIPHLNSDAASAAMQTSDHDPVLVRFGAFAGK